MVLGRSEMARLKPCPFRLLDGSGLDPHGRVEVRDVESRSATRLVVVQTSSRFGAEVGEEFFGREGVEDVFFR